MGNIIVHVASALICFSGNCHPALVGSATPEGQYPIVHVRTDLAGYGGDVLAFAQDAAGVYAIHRVWTLIPRQRRIALLSGKNAQARMHVTEGCINVMPDVYQALVDCCSRGRVTITG